MKIAAWKNCAYSHSVIPDVLALCLMSTLCLITTLLLFGLVPTVLAEEDAAPAESIVSAEELAASANFGLEAEEWWQPTPIVWRDGMAPIELKVDYAIHRVRDHNGQRRELRLRSYNDQLVGPTIEIRAGQTLRVKLDNKLPKNPDTPQDAEAAAKAHHAAMLECPNKPHAFNSTNLHTHGLHISPKAPADDVLLSVNPGDPPYNYIFPILPAGTPPGQPSGTHYPGTFWYHAHRHGSTAMQLASGMAGALILKGDVDELPQIKNINDRLFVLQQIAYGENNAIEDFDQLRNNWDNVVQKRTRINGRLYPRIRLRPGQIERWRLIDSGVFADLPLQIVPERGGSPPMRMFQIAADGITFARPMPLTLLELAPGNRADLLVVAPMTRGRYFLFKGTSRYDLTATGMSEADPAGPELLAEIVVDPNFSCEPRCGQGIPSSLTAPTRMLPPITKIRDRKEVTFSVEPQGPGKPPKFMIEGDCYDPEIVLDKFKLKLSKGEEGEEWTLLNTSGGPHPFHIHVNAFQVMDQGGVWRDTVMIPPAKNGVPGRVRIRTRFERFDGTFVTHCHILNHEDLGMMQKVVIEP